MKKVKVSSGRQINLITSQGINFINSQNKIGNSLDALVSMRDNLQNDLTVINKIISLTSMSYDDIHVESDGDLLTVAASPQLSRLMELQSLIAAPKELVRQAEQNAN